LLCLAGIVGIADEAQGRFLSARDGALPPHGRVGCFASPSLGTRYLGPSELGAHGYRFNLHEGNGIMYTARGGHIDIVHVRKAADWTAYLAFQTRQFLLKNTTSFSYRMAEPTKYHVKITYPKDWSTLPAEAKEETASRVAVGLAQYFTFAGTTWHEIITWFGFRSIGVYSEFPSAFSWEDSYSNLLGSYLAGRALIDPDRDYDEAMTMLLDREMEVLRAQPRRTAWEAGTAVRDVWFAGNFFFCDMIRRNFDIGTDDGFVTPWVVPDVAPCPEGPISYPVPDLAFLDEYGFSVTFEIEPKEWERGKVLRLLRHRPKDKRKLIEPARHFEPIMAYVRAQAIKHYGPAVDTSGIRQPQARQTATPLFAENPHGPFADEIRAGVWVDMEPVSDDETCREVSQHSFSDTSCPDIADIAVFAGCWLAEEASFTIEAEPKKGISQPLRVAHRSKDG
jgi:hypothetical protein